MPLAMKIPKKMSMMSETLRLSAAWAHILKNRQEHWEAGAFIDGHISGEPWIKEPGKCSDFGWFSLDALPATLTALSEEHLRAYHRKFGPGLARDLSYLGSIA